MIEYKLFIVKLTIYNETQKIAENFWATHTLNSRTIFQSTCLSVHIPHGAPIIIPWFFTTHTQPFVGRQLASSNLSRLVKAKFTFPTSSQT